MPKIIIKVGNGDAREVDGFFAAIRYLADHDDMPDPKCPKCGENEWKTWRSAAMCRACGNVLDLDDYASLMGLDL